MRTLMGMVTAKVQAQAQRLVTVLALAALQACGPGVGGSGTGQGLDAFGANAASLCGSDIAPALACPSSTAAPGASAAGNTDAGSGTVFFADTVDGRRVAVTVQGNSIELNAPCARISFRGQWGLLAGQAARFYGTNGEGASAQPAQVRASLASGGLLLTVLDANGDLLLGPVLVTVRATPASPGSC
jgi:hypothetical protein